MLKAAIFDMDGLLIDSEPFWRDVEVRVFGRLGVPLTHDMCRETMGFRINEAVAHWRRAHPWDGPGDDEVADELIAGVIECIEREGQLMDGVVETIDFVAGQGARLAIASSALYRVIDAVLDRFGLRDRFEVIHSAEDEDLGKPDPAVYVTTAAKLGVRPDLCVAFEDSVNGVISAKAAGMQCVAVPDPSAASDRRFDMADFVLRSLRELDTDIWGALTRA